jgi:hypothetical protein
MCQYVYHQTTDVLQQICRESEVQTILSHIVCFDLEAKTKRMCLQKREALGIWILTKHLKCKKSWDWRKGGRFWPARWCISLPQGMCHREIVLSSVCIIKIFAGRRPFGRLMHRWKGIFKMYLGKWLCRCELDWIHSGYNKVNDINDESCVS